MSFGNYGQLKTFLGTFGNRTDLATTIPDCISATESMIAAEVRAIEMVTSVTLDESDRASGAKYNLPTNFLGARALYGTYNSSQYAVTIVGLGELRNYRATTPPFFGSTYGYTLEFRGTPETDSEFELIYFAKPTAMSSDSDAPSLLTNHPELYLHGGLHWLHMKTQDLELAKAHLDLFREAVERVNAAATRQRGGSRTAPGYNLGNYSRSAY